MTTTSPTFTRPRTRVRWLTGRDLTGLRRTAVARRWLARISAAHNVLSPEPKTPSGKSKET